MTLVTAPFRPAFRKATYLTLLYLLSSVPVAAAVLGLLIAGWTATGVLLVTPLVVVALVSFRVGTGLLAALDAALVRELLGTDVRPRISSGGAGFWARGRAVVTDGSFWRQQAYLGVRMTLGFGAAVAEVTLLGAALEAITYPVWYRWSDLHFGSWQVDTFARSWVLVPAGVVALAVALQLVPVLGRASAWLARVLLDDESRVRATPRARRLALAIHATAASTAAAIVLVVWALTSHHSFWPEWVVAPLALVLAIHWWVDSRWGDPLDVHMGVAGGLLLFFVACWAFAGGGYFWPEWPAFAAALTIGAHALAIRSTGGRRLAQRIGVLESTRAGAVDAEETNLRRIERDLHDGAQARLVALGISLGLAESKLASDPAAAESLVKDARQGVQDALTELRELVRGIHPPVLTDRGLPAALAGLADLSPLPVDLAVELPERQPAAVESAAYFVVAEALANATKHAGATRIEVRVRRHGTSVEVEVEDDGRGGADPTGNGLSGLRQRVEALDGTLSVTSPSGGPTIVRAELPCVR